MTASVQSAGHKNDSGRRLDAQLAAVGEGQHGVFPLAQLVSLGLTARAVQHRAAAGRLHRVYQGVYALVPAAMLSLRGRYRAAVLACGRSAALAHRSAGDFQGLRVCHRRTIEVIVPGRSTHRHRGIQVHRSVHLAPQDITLVDAIPVTTVARTLLDLAAVVPRRGLERALDQAEIERLFDLTALIDQLRRNPGHPGAGRLRATLGRHEAGSTVTRSDFEERLLPLLDSAGLPRPEVNPLLGLADGGSPIRPDFVWRAQRLIVETDGAKFHLTRGAFEDDHDRDLRLKACGWEVLRITWRQLHEQPGRVLAAIAALLAR